MSAPTTPATHTYTHTGYRRETGYIHAARLYGHANYAGKVHALNGTAHTYSGAPYRALCSREVTAEHDGERFNVRPASEGGRVTCKRCLRVIAASQTSRAAP